MKKVFVWLLICCPVVASAQAKHFIIEGSLGNYNAPAKVYLQYYERKQDITDSATVVNGKFKFTGDAEDDPIMGVLIFNAQGNGVNNGDIQGVCIEQGTITVNGTDKLKDARIGGTPANVDNGKLNVAMATVKSEWDDLNAKVNAANNEQRQTPEFQSELNNRIKDIQEQQNVVYKKFITEHPDSYISLVKLDAYSYSGDYQNIELLYNHLTGRLKQTALAQKLATKLPRIKAIAIGATAPDFTEADTSGKMISLSSLRGKYVLVDFWASWCHPCRAENPNILKAFNQYKDKNFTVIGVSLDGPGERNNWLAAIKADGLPWAQVSDLKAWDDRAAVLYLINGIPQNFLIDPNGKIIAKELRADDLEKELAKNIK